MSSGITGADGGWKDACRTGATAEDCRPPRSAADTAATVMVRGAATAAAAGGLSPDLWQALRHSRVDHALAASLPYHYEDLAGQEMQPLLLDSLLQQAPPAGSLPFLAPFTPEMPHA
ncbi:hypothetical protein [Desulfovibrio piger]|uniref:hypothetical protein n=1 Tax=Desulfovibrio piger TaxID=901 RepID=UPI0026F0B899|nr:hypothetical protein [Desulfovibrio piger]